MPVWTASGTKVHGDPNCGLLNLTNSKIREYEGEVARRHIEFSGVCSHCGGAINL